MAHVTINLPYNQEYVLLSEFNLLSHYHAPGVYVLPDEESPTKWNGFIAIRNGVYIGAVFQFELKVPPNFPSQDTPRIFMPVGLYHPDVNLNTGEVDLLSYYPLWKPGTNRIWQLIHHLKRILTNPACTRASPHRLASTDAPTAASDILACYANPDAADAMLHNPVQFEAKVKECIHQLSVWNSQFPIHPAGSMDNFDFRGWNKDQFIQRAKGLLQKDALRLDEIHDWRISSPQGYSWLDPKENKIFAVELTSNSDQRT